MVRSKPRRERARVEREREVEAFGDDESGRDRRREKLRRKPERVR
jgi:hypothetical protein